MGIAMKLQKNLTLASFAILVLSTYAVIYVLTETAYAAVPSLVWSRALPDKVIESSPMPVNFGQSYDHVMFGSNDKNVYVLDGLTGNNVTGWPKLTSNPIQSTPSSADVDHDGNPDIFI